MTAKPRAGAKATKAWARRLGRIVHHGAALAIYATRKEAEAYLLPGDRIVRVEIREVERVDEPKRRAEK